jgi:chemotaxis protein methyltransferase CheR
MPPRMTDGELSLFTRYVADLSGIALDQSKRYLLESRLEDLLREAGCASYADLYKRAKGGGDRSLERRIVDAVSTNETFFFRDAKAFDLIKHKLVPELMGDDPRRPLKIWSAASSTGQEAYTLTMALKDILFDLSATRLSIVGTDISEAAVNAANRGEYTTLELSRGLDAKLQAKHFRKLGAAYRINDELRSVCRFQVDNLLAPATAGPFDIILCRNVLIYFTAQDKATVVKNLLARLKRPGFLLVGATESLLGVTDRVRRQEFHGSTYYTPL